MTDTERMDFIERHNPTIQGFQDDALVSTDVRICVGRVTGWITRPTAREAIDAASEEIKRLYRG